MDYLTRLDEESGVYVSYSCGHVRPRGGKPICELCGSPISTIHSISILSREKRKRIFGDCEGDHDLCCPD